MQPPSPPRNHRSVSPGPIGAAQFLPVGAAGLAALAAAGWSLSLRPPALLVAGAVFGTLAVVLAGTMRRLYPHPRIGACNLVTLLRAALVCALLAALWQGHTGGWPIAGVALLALVLDGLDGWLARRSGLVSDFGARFDIEVDAAFALVLSLHALARTEIGGEVLILGLIRYVFVIATWFLPWLNGPLPPSRRRKLVCVLQLSALIALQPPLLGPDTAIIAVRLAAAALVWSFWVDLRHLARQRR